MLRKLMYPTILCVAMTVMACGEHEDTAGILELTGDATAGATIYSGNCAGCHGANGKGGSFDVEIIDASDSEVVSVVLSGDGDMPSYRDQLSDQEVANLLAYVNTL